jgi:hypothetical protein
LGTKARRCCDNQARDEESRSEEGSKNSSNCRHICAKEEAYIETGTGCNGTGKRVAVKVPTI